MKTLLTLAALLYINCIVSPGLTICTDSTTGQSWTIMGVN